MNSYTSVGAGPISITTVTTLQDSDLNLIVFRDYLPSLGNIYYTLPLVPSSEVRNLTAVAQSSTITISWSSPVMSDLNGVPTRYTLRYSGVEFQTEEKTVVVNYTSSTNETVSVSGLEAYTVYKISVTLNTTIGVRLSFITPEDLLTVFVISRSSDCITISLYRNTRKQRLTNL